MLPTHSITPGRVVIKDTIVQETQLKGAPMRRWGGSREVVQEKSRRRQAGVITSASANARASRAVAIMEGAPTPCVATHLLARCTTNEKRDKGKMGLRGKVKRENSPAKGARYWRGAASEAVAATTMEYFMASFSSRVWTS
jgi:hypothetical protein